MRYILLILILGNTLLAQQFPPHFRADTKLPPIPTEVPTAEPFKIPESPFPLPTWEEITKMEWEQGWVADWKDLASKRAKEYKTDKNIEWVLNQRPDVPEGQKVMLTEDMKKIYTDMIAVLCQPPASDSEVDWDAEFRRHIVAPETLNAILVSSSYEMDVTNVMYAGAMNFDHQLVALADARFVKEWWRHKEGLYDVLILRDDLLWEDGMPWTAYDIEFSYHMIMKESISVPAQRSGTDEMKWVKAYDSNKIVFFHKESLATNQWNINFGILPKHIYERSITENPTMVDSKWHSYWNNYPLASGAYRITERTTNHILLERRDSFYLNAKGEQIRPKPYMKYVRFKVIDNDSVALLEMKNGNIDEFRVTASQFMRQTSGDEFYKHNLKVYGPTWTYMYICWQQKGNPPNPFFHDLRVRKAMSYAFNMERWLNDMNYGLFQQGAGTFHPDSPWGTPELELIQRDIEYARELLEEAGWAGDKNNNGIIDKEVNGERVDFEFTMTIPTSGTAGDCAVILQQDLKELGIKMNIQRLEWATYQERTHEKKFQACCAAWGSGSDPDTSSNIWTTIAYENGRNYGGYSNLEVDELFEAGKREFNFEKRREIYQRINQLIYEDQPYTFLNHRAEIWAFNKELRGYNFSPRDPFGYLMGFDAIWKAKKK